MDGVEVLQRLKGNQDTNPIPVIMLTAKCKPRDEIRGIKAGATDYITKPFFHDDLRARVRMALACL